MTNDNSNDSLNNITNNNYKFNTSSDGGNNKSGKNLDKNYATEKEENDKATKKLTDILDGASDKDKEGITSNINKLAVERKGITESLERNFNGDNTNKSLFDKDARIDYARFVSAKKKWINYSGDVDGNANKTFTLNNGSPINTLVSGDPDLKNSNDGLTINHLVGWSESYPALQLKFQDFVYCKNLGMYPNNRLVVLRRFKNGVPDNLFDYYDKDESNLNYSSPLSTMITWLKPDQSPMTMNFKENWTKNSDGVFEFLSKIMGNIESLGVPVLETIGSVGKKFVNTVTVNDKNNNLLGDTFSSSLLQLFSKQGIKIDGNPFLGRSPAGNPNLVLESSKRNVGGDGISSTISFDLDFEYEMRYVNDVDSGIAILDLISNCLRMGTSVSEFRFNVSELADYNARIKMNSDFGSALKEFTSRIGDVFTFDTKKFENIINSNSNGDIQFDTDAIVSGAKNVVHSTADHIISRYREHLKSAISAETGIESGIWHVSIGNPKNPIVSCGDLIIARSSLELGKELGYNDFPNSFKVTYNLEQARNRGRDEIEKIFNTGRGRVYVYDKIEDNPDYDRYKL